MIETLPIIKKGKKELQPKVQPSKLGMPGINYKRRGNNKRARYLNGFGWAVFSPKPLITPIIEGSSNQQTTRRQRKAELQPGTTTERSPEAWAEQDNPQRMRQAEQRAIRQQKMKIHQPTTWPDYTTRETWTNIYDSSFNQRAIFCSQKKYVKLLYNLHRELIKRLQF